MCGGWFQFHTMTVDYWTPEHHTEHVLTMPLDRTQRRGHRGNALVAKIQVFTLSFAIVVAVSVAYVTSSVFPLIVTGCSFFIIAMVYIFLKYIIEPGVLPLVISNGTDQGAEYGTFPPYQNNAFEDSLPNYEQATQHLTRPVDQQFTTAVAATVVSTAPHKSTPKVEPPTYEDATRNYPV